MLRLLMDRTDWIVSLTLFINYTFLILTFTSQGLTSNSGLELYRTFTQQSSLLSQLCNWLLDVTSVREQGWLTAEPVKLKVSIARRCHSHFLQRDFAYSRDTSSICDNLEYWPITGLEIFTAGLLLTRKLLGEIWSNSVKIRNCHGDIYVCDSWKNPQEQVCAFRTGPKRNILKLR